MAIYKSSSTGPPCTAEPRARGSIPSAAIPGARRARTAAAVLGLIGSDWLTDIAARITIPVEFVLQWDDEGNPPDSVLKLFDALGSAEKTLHANPGGHFRVPSFEIDSSIRFFARHLGSSGTASGS